MLGFLSLLLSTGPGTEVDGREENSSRNQSERSVGFCWLRAETCGLKKPRSAFYPKMRSSICGDKRQKEPQGYLHLSLYFHWMEPATGVDLGYREVK